MSPAVFTVLVFGGRDFSDERLMDETLDRLHARRPFGLLIHGGAPGADRLSGAWAKKRGIPVRVFEADWGKFGKSAGPRRNQQMLDEGLPDLAVAFPGGRGTADMKAKVTRKGISLEEAR